MYAKVLGQDWAWRVGGMARRPAGLEQSKSLVPVGFARCPLGTESDLPEVGSSNDISVEALVRYQGRG